jgi:hypothetical protein
MRLACPAGPAVIVSYFLAHPMGLKQGGQNKEHSRDGLLDRASQPFILFSEAYAYDL